MAESDNPKNKSSLETILAAYEDIEWDAEEHLAYLASLDSVLRCAITSYRQKIRLIVPLSEDAKSAVIKAFDGSNINSSEGHWWGSKTEEDNPSHPRNTKIDPDGTIHMEGIDFTEGKFSTFLTISGDRTVIDVDTRWNAGRIRKVLKELGVDYKIV